MRLKLGKPSRIGNGSGGRQFCTIWYGWHRRRLDGKELRVTGFLGAGLAGKNGDEGRVALHQQAKGGVHRLEILKGVHAVGARAQFAGSLRPTKEQDAQQRDFVTVEVKRFIEAVLEFGDTAIRIGGAHEELIGEGAQRLADGILVKRHNGIAIRLLIAGVQESIKGERIVFRRGDFFFN